MLTAIVEEGVVQAETAPHPVPWWSFSKTVLAAAALHLVAQGHLPLDRPLSGREYTLRHLLQHRAGLPDYGGWQAYHQAVADGEPPWPVAEVRRRMDADSSHYPPGSGWRYSNIGYLEVRQVIEAVTGSSLAQALQQLVFAPLGLTEDGVGLARVPADLADTAWGNAQAYHPGWVYHGLVVGPAAAAASLLAQLMGGALLPSALLAAMCERYPLPGPVRGWQQPGYGLGLMIDAASTAGSAYGHTGQGPGSSAAVYHFPDRDPPRTVAVFAAVADEGRVEEMARRLAVGEWE